MFIFHLSGKTLVVVSHQAIIYDATADICHRINYVT
jgi:hypothetical protein